MENKDYSKGNLLVAEPFLQDPNFKRSVTLICEHSPEEGSAGLVLGKKMNMTLGDAIPDLKKHKYPLYLGGPVANDTLHFLHNFGEELDGSNEVCEGLWWGGNFERLKIMIDLGAVSPDDIRFFIGYSGWAPGQLEMEMQEESWFTHPARAEHIFKKQSTDSLWEQILLEKGGQYKQMINYPEDPQLN